MSRSSDEEQSAVLSENDEEEQPLAPPPKKKKKKKNRRSKKQRSKKDTAPLYSLWLLDRTRGRSHPDLDSKPPAFCCYVPLPVYWFRRFMEQNIVCETTGRVGCVNQDDPKVRTRVLSLGLFANVMALWMTFYACFAISQSFMIIRATSFSRGQVTILNNTRIFAKIDIGLTAVAFENFVSFDVFKEPGEHVITFDSFCSLAGDGLERYLDPAQCQACADSSNGLVQTIIFSLITVLPNLTTDFLRSYPNYDSNCQKFFGSIIGAISMALSLLTYYKYNQECFSVFYEGVVPFYLNKTVADTTEQLLINNRPIVEAFFDWGPGPGVICMFIATSLKILDIVAMLIVPTPQITRDHELQKEYERLYQQEVEDGADGSVGEGNDDDYFDDEGV